MGTEELEKIWTVTKSTDEIVSGLEREEECRKELERGLAKCSVCRCGAKVVEFGLEGNGVWIGCDRTGECSRYIEIHTEGWSVKEVAEEWNRYNSGMFLMIRRVKRWFRERFGAEKRRKDRENKKILIEKLEKEAKRREILGISEPKKMGFWGKLLARRQKVYGKTSVGAKEQEEAK